MALLFTNNAAATLASGISAGATSLTVSSGQGALFPTITGSDYFLLTLQNVGNTATEIVKVTARSTDTMTIVRAQESTTASSFSGGDFVQLRITAAAMSLAANTVGANGAIIENNKAINANYTISTGKNGMSAGPITLGSGITVTVPSGSRWVIV
jgi:hypothetical protein